MSVIAVVQARMGSSRLPGKVLMDIGGRPMLTFMLDRLASANVDEIVVATSVAPADDPIVGLCRANGVRVVRGSEHNVLDRFVTAVDEVPADHVVRLTADCPLIDGALVDQLTKTHLTRRADYTSNTLVRTFPDGLDVEVVSVASLRLAARYATDPAEREHVTPYIYRRPEQFDLLSVMHPLALGDERWTVDTESDLSFIRDLVERLADPLAGWADIASIAGVRAMPDVLRVRPALTRDECSIPTALRFNASRPGTRGWIIERDGSYTGWLFLRIRDGTGLLQGELNGEGSDEVWPRFRRHLLADLQVRRIRIDPDLPWSPVWTEARGYAQAGSQIIWVR